MLLLDPFPNRIKKTAVDIYLHQLPPFLHTDFSFMSHFDGSRCISTDWIHAFNVCPRLCLCSLVSSLTVASIRTATAGAPQQTMGLEMCTQTSPRTPTSTLKT